MNALLTTLPGDIPRLLRRGSPLLDCGHPCLCREVFHNRDGSVSSIRHDRAYHADGRVDSFALDLTDPTGRVHAAAWAYHHPAIHGFTGLSRDERAVMETALHFDPMTPEQIDLLARLVVRLAGRTP